MQPRYHEIEYKQKARAENVKIFRRVTGLDRIPEGKEYWTLCHLQTHDEGAEIVQLKGMGFLGKTQFHGVDTDVELIRRNTQYHPSAHWYHGEWTDVIDHNVFNPSMVYLDTTCFSGHRRSIDLTARTMMRCPDGTVLFVNTMLNDPRSSRRFNSSRLLDMLHRKVPPSELTKWEPMVENYEYSTTGKTDFVTHVFYKPGKVS